MGTKIVKNQQNFAGFYHLRIRKVAGFGTKMVGKWGKVAEVWMFVAMWYTFNYYGGTLFSSIFYAVAKNSEKTAINCEEYAVFRFL